MAERRAAAAAARAAGAAPAVAKPPPGAVFNDLQQDSATEIRFRLSPTHVTYANTLRRAMITEVETVAFAADIADNGGSGDVIITKNSTPMSNEMLAHRIGLLPIHVKNPLKWEPDQYTFKLDIVNDSTEPRDVVAADIQVLKNRGPDEDPLPVPSLELFHPDPVTRDTTLLTVLKGRAVNPAAGDTHTGKHDSEAVSFIAKAVIGTGRQNARFMPVTSRCAYGYTLDDSPERKKELFTKWLATNKKVSASELEANSTRKGELEREFETMEVQRCFKVNDRGEPFSFDFVVESVGVLDPKYIVARAIDLLQKKLLMYGSIDSGDLPEGLKMRPADALMKGFDFIFQHEDHTLGNLLSTWMEQNEMDSEEITYVGYKVPHPLRDEMLLRVGVESGKDTDARSAVAKAARALSQMFLDWSGQWAAVAGGR
jgi:DNA-directed RNA polymerase II subunit RPB3